MKQIMRQFALLSTATLVGFVGLQGCGDDETVNPPLLNDSEVMFIHGAADGGTVDIVVDDEVVASNLALGDVTTGYLDVDEGSRRIRVTPPANLAGAIFDETFDFDETKHYSAFVVTDSVGTPDILYFVDDLSEPATGEAHIRLVHLSPDHGLLKMGFAGSQRGGPVQDSVNFMDNTSFFQVVEPGTYNIRVTPSGAGNQGGGNFGIAPDVVYTLESGEIYTVVVVGKKGDDSESVFVIKHAHD